MTAMHSAPSRNVFVEFHVLTSYPPSNPNRDDLGSPKTARFGGHRRLRISSQCLKRTWRTSTFFRGEFAEESLGVRTAKLPEILRAELTKEGLGVGVIDGLVAMLMALGSKGKKPEDDDDADDEVDGDNVDAAPPAEDVARKENTKHLLFLSRQEIEEVKNFARENAKTLEALFVEKASKKKGKNEKPARVVDSEKVSAVREKFGEFLRERCKRNAVDVALFGRFLTSNEFNAVDAAMQVAHAIGTQQVEVEFDYFTAVDDRGDEPGAGHIGETEFASSVMYSYAACDLALLRQNLAGDAALAAQSMRAIALAMARAVPRGKQNSTAHCVPADYVEVVVRRDAPMSMANAFLRPVSVGSDEHARGDDVMVRSVKALQSRAETYHAGYSSDADVLARVAFSAVDTGTGSARRVKSLDELASAVRDAVAGVQL